MSAIVLLFILTVGSTLFVQLFRKPFEKVIGLYLLSATLVLYIMALNGEYVAGTWLVIGLSVAGPAIVFIAKKDPLRETFALIFTPGFVVFWIVAVFITLIDTGMAFVQWDEFTQWGLTLKNQFLTGSLPTRDPGTVHFLDYPPGLALLQNVWMIVLGFSEPNAYRSYGYVSLSLIIFFTPTRSTYTNHALLKIVVVAASVLLLPTVMFTDHYESIYVDSILGITFGYTLFSWFSLKDAQPLRLATTSSGLVFMVLLKASGMGLVVLAWIAFCLVPLTERGPRNLFLAFRGQPRFRNIRWLKWLLLVMTIVVIPVVVNLSWKQEIARSSTPAGAQSGLLDRLRSSVRQDSAFAAHVAYRVVQSVFEEASVMMGKMGLSYFDVVFLIVVGIVLVESRTRLSLSRSGITLAAGVTLLFVLYCCSLCVVYLLDFSKYEASNLASFHRYMNTFIDGVFLLAVGLLWNGKDGSVRSKLGMLTIPILVALFSTITPIATGLRQEVLFARNNTILSRRAAVTILAHARPGESVYLIYEGSKGYDYWCTRYLVTPVKVQEGGQWSLGNACYLGDIWTVAKNPADWARELSQRFNYVYVIEANQQFAGEYGSLFGGSVKVTNGTLYSVNKDKASGPLLIPVEGK